MRAYYNCTDYRIKGKITESYPVIPYLDTHKYYKLLLTLDLDCNMSN